MPHVVIASAGTLAIELDSGSRVAIHPLWLRERSRDAAVYDARTAQRLYDPSDLDPALRVTALMETRPGCFRVSFSDGHTTDYSEAELLAEAAATPGADDTPPIELWHTGADAPERVPWSSSPADAELAAWTAHFLRTGYLVLSGVPAEPGTVLKVAQTFGFVRVTNFGALFDVRSVPEACDLAYTTLHLDPHTDNPYRHPVPGVQLLHCLVNETLGGLSTLVDGFAAAEQLRETDPEAFRLLAGTPVQFRFRDAGVQLTASAPMLELDTRGQVRCVRFSPRLDFAPLLPPAELSGFYRARRALDQLLRSRERERRFLLSAGDLMMVDNQRLLHGRTSFDPVEGLRHLQGCYIDIDGPRSLYRVVRGRVAAARQEALR
jgi:gamma-butyrobetaine dioxygenase